MGRATCSLPASRLRTIGWMSCWIRRSGQTRSRRSRRTAAATRRRSSIAENTTVVTTVTATDPDAGQTLSYAIVGGADAAKFTINATTGALAFATAPNFEAPTDSGANNVYDVIVQVSDGSGGIDTQAIAVTVTNQNEAPTITSNGGGDTAAVVDCREHHGGDHRDGDRPRRRTDVDLFDRRRRRCGQVHDRCDDGRARLRDGPELRGSDRRGRQQRLRRHRPGSRMATAAPTRRRSRSR